MIWVADAKDLANVSRFIKNALKFIKPGKKKRARYSSKKKEKILETFAILRSISNFYYFGT